MSRRSVPPHSVLPSACQGHLEVTRISLGTLFAEYPSMPVILSHLFLRSCPAIETSTLQCRTTSVSLCPLLSSSPLAHDKAAGRVCTRSALQCLKWHRLVLHIQ